MKTATDWAGPAILTAAVILAGFALTVAVNWPGHLSYDSILQLWQGRSGHYTSWHPPVMAWLLGLGDAVVPGTGLFVLFDAVLAFGALAVLFALRPGRATWWTAGAAAFVVLTPQLLLYQGLVWKDVLFADAAVAGFTALAWAGSRWNEAGQRAVGQIAAMLLLLLAALARQNGVILLPVAAVAWGWIAARNGEAGWRVAVLGVAFLVLQLGGVQSATYWLSLRSDDPSGPSEQIRLLQTYDLAGALAREPGLPLDSLSDDDPKFEHLLRTKGARLYTPVRNDPLAADPEIQAALSDADPDEIAVQWQALVSEHPWLYLRVRAAAFTQVFATPDIAACRPIFTGIEGPARELGELGIAPRRDARDRMLEAYGKAFFNTPELSHVAFAALAIACLVLLLRRRRTPDIAVAAMLAGALAFSASFFFISIACDYRYLYALDLSALAALLYLVGGLRLKERS